jgi:hypothetical protein
VIGALSGIAVMLEVQRIGSEAKQTGETLTTGGS